MRLQIDKLGKVSITVEEEPWDELKSYNRLTIVGHHSGIAYISRCLVPRNIPITDRRYWVPLGVISAPIQANNYKILDNESDLPLTEENYEGPYIIDNYGYFWVGSGGNIEDKPQYKKIQLAGAQGKSAYQFYKEYMQSIGEDYLSEEAWSANFAKIINLNISDLIVGVVKQINVNNTPNYPDSSGIIDITIPRALNAYELYVDSLSEGEEVLTITSWLESLKGKSAYDLAKENGFRGTLQEWLNSLKGEPGIQGIQGMKGDSILGTEEGVIETLIINDTVKGGEAKLLSAEIGRRLGNVVIERKGTTEELANIEPTTQAEVGTYGLLRFDTSLKLLVYYWYENVQEVDDAIISDPSNISTQSIVTTQDNSHVDQELDNIGQVLASDNIHYIKFSPNPNILYCIILEGVRKIVCWDSLINDFVDVAGGGGGLSARVVGSTLILENAVVTPQQTPVITLPVVDNNFACKTEEVTSRHFNLITRNITSNIKLSFTGTNAANFSVTPSNISSDNANGTIDIMITYSPGAVSVGTTHSATLEVRSDNVLFLSIEFAGKVVTGPTIVVNSEELTINAQSGEVGEGLITLSGQALEDDVELTLDGTGLSFDSVETETTKTLLVSDFNNPVDVPIYFVGNENVTGTLTIESTNSESTMPTKVIDIYGVIVSRKEADEFFIDPNNGYRFRVLVDTNTVETAPYGTDGTNYGSANASTSYEDVVEIPNIAIDENGIEYNVVKLGRSTFYKCYSLTDVVLPDSITSVYSGTIFNGCPSLKYVKFGNGLIHTYKFPFSYNNVDENNANAYNRAIETFDFGTSFVISSSEAQGAVCYNCPTLKHVVFRNPNTVLVPIDKTFGKSENNQIVSKRVCPEVKIYVPNSLLSQYKSRADDASSAWNKCGFTSADFYSIENDYVEPNIR